MICLKNRTFAVSQTTQKFFRKKLNGLWFAWKIVLLQYHKQPWKRYKNDCCGCDLLEKSYFCSITNNNCSRTSVRHCVVICLKNRTFAVSQTTCSVWQPPLSKLWFAWKIVLLQYHKQRCSVGFCPWTRCDLLEKSYFCSITNNLATLSLAAPWLWFAWKIVLLQYHKQPRYIEVVQWLCCDLLEKSYFCSITNNGRSWRI